MRLQTIEDDLRRLLIDYLYLLSRDVSQKVLETILRRLAAQVEIMRGCIPLLDEETSSDESSQSVDDNSQNTFTCPEDGFYFINTEIGSDHEEI